MNIAAYCRVSTDKQDQLNSLEAQKAFFAEYTSRTGDKLVRLYADEGISGTKIKNRHEFLRMMADAEHGLFDMVVVKDISRFARNTVDLLQNVRKLKSLGIETQFLTANMTSMGNSEFILTIFGALAQEESANTSKRVKFGKKLNAERGRVPNIVYGYDKTAGEYFKLTINEEEAAIICQIYRWYVCDGYGAAKIASFLNERGIRTKRNCKWSQNSVCRILTNELYTGKIINGKQEITDFLTGRRKDKDESEWIIVDRPELQIIEPSLFEHARKIMISRGNAFRQKSERQSNKHLFSTLIKCGECGWSFRRTVRTYKNTYVRWVCSGRNINGKGACTNSVSIDEKDLMEVLHKYFVATLEAASDLKLIRSKICRAYMEQDYDIYNRKTLDKTLEKLEIKRTKYMDMYIDNLISRKELLERITLIQSETAQIENEIRIQTLIYGESRSVQDAAENMISELESFTDIKLLTNAQLKTLVHNIDVQKDGSVDIYIRNFENVPV